MKRKFYFPFIILLLNSFNLIYGAGEELKFVIKSGRGTTNMIKVTVSTSNYAWNWSENRPQTGYVILDTHNYPITYGPSSNISFDSPASKELPEEFIPWGLMDFKVESLLANGTVDFYINFSLDLRDQNWAHITTNYPGNDTYIEIDQISKTVYIKTSGATPFVQTLNDGDNIKIWEFWNIGTHEESNFTIPVTLQNRIEGQTFDFGNLLANNQPVNSGNPAYYQFNSSKSVNVGTIDTTYLNQRNYNFKWDYFNIEPNVNTVLYNTQLDFSTLYTSNTKSITRNFRAVWPLTIKNNLGEVGGISTDNISFKDPTTDNTYHSYPTGSSGYVKDNAFDSLSILVGSNPNQKYGAKAVSIISYNGHTYQYTGGDFSTSGTDFLITAPTTLVANYKGVRLSSQTDAIAGNGQRKIIKTPGDGYLHRVYTSLNKVWYERSTDNGQTWQIMNGGRAVSVDGYKAKGASIDYFTNSYHNLVVIVYQQQTVWGSAINADIFENGANQRNEVLVNYYHSSGDFDNFNAKPVIAINPNAQVLIAWYENGEVTGSISESGLYYKYGYIYHFYGVSWYFNWYNSSPVKLGGTNILSTSPSLDTHKSSVQSFQLVFERDNTIYYNTLTDNINHINHIQEATTQNISSGSGYTYNNNPSILAVNGGARVVWEGSNNGSPKRVVFRDPGYYYFWNFSQSGSYNCLAPNICRPDDYSAYFFCWSENNNGYVLNNSLSYVNIKSLGITGQYMQLSNGSTPGTMFATTLNTSGSPYSFTLSNSIGSFYGLAKSKNSFAGIEGRKGVVFKDTADFYFDISKIKVDGQNIGFVEINKEENITDTESLNKYLVTESFELSNKTTFTYSVNYGVTDTASANAVLKENDLISFKLQLIDDNNNKVIGEFDKVTYSKNNVSEYKNINYKVDTKGIGNKTVRLKLIVSNNFKSGYALSMSSFGDGSAELNKEGFKQIAYNQNLTVTEYALMQNYPNPFNPSTTINYQLPKEGLVTLTIYDILGREVKTLVNQFKSKGRYSVNFNAGQLASGVYIYRIKVNDFSTAKKLLLMK